MDRRTFRSTKKKDRKGLERCAAHGKKRSPKADKSLGALSARLLVSNAWDDQKSAGGADSLSNLRP